MIRVVLPTHLRTLVRIDGEVHLDVTGPATQRSVLDAFEARLPMLRGTIRGHDGGPRRAFIRFFARELEMPHDPPDDPLPDAVAGGTEPISSSAPWQKHKNAGQLGSLRTYAHRY
jgi:molybdopterin synthase sulfur carrier subunit